MPDTTTETPKAPRYAQVDWRECDGEYFAFICGNFDVDAAKRILKGGKRPKKRPIRALAVADVKNLLASPPDEGIFRIGVTVDWDRVENDPSIDLSVPVIMVTLKSGCLPIDGWHRIAKALAEGREYLDAVVLTEAESKKVRL